MGMTAACPKVKMRTVDGAYVQTQVSVLPKLDLRAGAGITRVHRLPEDLIDTVDDDADPTTPANDDDPVGPTGLGGPGIPDSVTYVTLRQQVGIGAGMTFHAADNIHITLEYFRAMFQWYKPAREVPGSRYPQQTLNFVNAGVTYDF
jgi:hypothetical protein